MAGGWLSRGANFGVNQLSKLSGDTWFRRNIIGRAGAGLGHFGSMGTAAQRAIAGGVMGGTYGMFADNTSMLGGAMIGAGIGAGSAGVGAAYRKYRPAYDAMRLFEHSRFKGLAAVMADIGYDSRRFIGNTKRHAVNGWNAMKGRATSGFPMGF